jgi:predicted dehydrogenase
MKRIGIGLVGVGIAAASAHLPALAESEDFELLALCDQEGERLAAAAQKWNIARVSCDLADFLRTPGLEAVIVATPPDSHAPLALACIAAGMHLLLEKPLGTCVAECESIVDAARTRRVRVAVNHEKRFHPTLQRVGRLLREGAIGRPYFGGVHWASNVKLAPDSFIPPGFEEGYRWRWSDPKIGGGIVQDHLPHYVDLFAHWMGAAPTAVYAQTWNIAKDQLSWDRTQSIWEDMGLVVARLSNDFVFRLETGVVGRSLSPLWSLGSGVGEWTEYGYILGTGGQLLFDLLPWDSSENGRLALWQLGRAQQEKTGWAFVEQAEPTRRHGSPAGAARAMFSSQLGDFARLIRDQPNHIATAEDGRTAVAAVEAAYLSAIRRCECPVAGTSSPNQTADAVTDRQFTPHLSRHAVLHSEEYE